MTRRLFTLAALLSLFLCLCCAEAAASFWVYWRHGVFASAAPGAPVVHQPSDLAAARVWAAATVISAILPLLWLARILYRRTSPISDRRSIVQSGGPAEGDGLRLTEAPGRILSAQGIPLTDWGLVAYAKLGGKWSGAITATLTRAGTIVGDDTILELSDGRKIPVSVNGVDYDTRPTCMAFSGIELAAGGAG